MRAVREDLLFVGAVWKDRGNMSRHSGTSIIAGFVWKGPGPNEKTKIIEGRLPQLLIVAIKTSATTNSLIMQLLLENWDYGIRGFPKFRDSGTCRFADLRLRGISFFLIPFIDGKGTFILCFPGGANDPPNVELNTDPSILSGSLDTALNPRDVREFAMSCHLGRKSTLTTRS